MHAFFGDLAQRLEAEDLKAARVGEDGRAPVHEPVKAAVFSDDPESRPQPQVEVLPSTICAPLAATSSGDMAFTVVGTDRHECRCVDAPVRELEHAAARGTVGGNGKLHASISIASPYEKKR